MDICNFNFEELPHSINTGMWDAGHIQGIALDTEKKYICYSFTTVLVKAEVATGKVIGYVDGLIGHLILGYFYFSNPRKIPINAGKKKLQASEIRLYRFTGEAPEGFEPV